MRNRLGLVPIFFAVGSLMTSCSSTPTTEEHGDRKVASDEAMRSGGTRPMGGFGNRPTGVVARPAPRPPPPPVKPPAGGSVVRENPHAGVKTDSNSNPVNTVKHETTVISHENGGGHNNVVTHNGPNGPVHTIRTETHADGSFVRSDSNGAITNRSHEGLETRTLPVMENGKEIHREVYHESFAERPSHIRDFDGHRFVERRYWDARVYAYWGWGPPYIWLYDNYNWNVFYWSRWNDVYLGWWGWNPSTCHSWNWGWRWHSVVSYCDPGDWYVDYLFGTRYWLYRHAEEAAHAAGENAALAGILGGTTPTQIFSQYKKEKDLMKWLRKEVDWAMQEGHSDTHYAPDKLVTKGRYFIAGVDYTMNIRGGSSVCDLTRGSIIKLTKEPKQGHPAEAQVVYDFDPNDDTQFCAHGTKISLAGSDLVEMSNDFRSKVQDALDEKNSDGQTLREAAHLQ